MSRSLSLHLGAFFADALLRRALTVAVVLFGADALGGGGWAGALYLGLMLPYLASWYAGVVIDGGTPRTTLRASTAATAGLVATLAGASMTADAGPAMFAVLLAYGTASAFAYTAFMARPPAGQGDELTRATIVMNVLSLASYVGGPALVGVLRAALPWPAVFLSLTTLAAASMILAWTSSATAVRTRRTADTAVSPTGALRAALGFLATESTPRPLFGLVALFATLVVGPIEVFMPIFSVQVLGMTPGVSGAFLAAGGVGIVTGSIAALRWLDVQGAFQRLCRLTVWGALTMLAITVFPAVAAAPAYLAAGVMAGLFSSTALATIQRQVPSGSRGVAMGIYALSVGAPPAIGGAIAGALAEAVTLLTAMRVVFGAVAVVFALLLAFKRPSAMRATLSRE